MEWDWELINETTKLLLKKINCRIMGKFSSTPVFKAMIKDENWKYLGEKRLMGSMQKGANMLRGSGFREKGVKTYNFEYRNDK